MEEIKPSERIGKIMQERSCHVYVAILQYLDEQAAKCSERSKPMMYDKECHTEECKSAYVKRLHLQAYNPPYTPNDICVCTSEPSKADIKNIQDTFSSICPGYPNMQPDVKILKAGINDDGKLYDFTPKDFYETKMAKDMTNMIKPTEPSKCEQEITRCKHGRSYGYCECFAKPSDSGGEKEVEELANDIMRSNKADITKGEAFCTAEDLIKEGYSKQPKSNQFVALDEQKVYEIIEYPSHNNRHLAQIICSKFGQPKVNFLSVEEIEKILINHRFCSTKIISQVIYDVMKRD